ncbi:MAG TPA: HEAT repeat domain-containing protein [Candidatus Binatia bacterium]
MNPLFLRNVLSRSFDIRPGDARPVVIMASLFFFLLAAINVIKVVRDSLFLSRFPITHLPYVYLLAAVFAGVIIAAYNHWTEGVSVYRLILSSTAVLIFNVALFWTFIVIFELLWAIYVFYVWSAIVNLLAVAQFWTFVGTIFNPREAKRLFGIIAAGGSVGAAAGGLVSGWAVNLFTGTGQLFWLIAALFAGAFGVLWLSGKELGSSRIEAPERSRFSRPNPPPQPGTPRLMGGSRYLQTIAGVLFISVIVSTLIDFEFKAAAKIAYPTEEGLSAFFGSYYAWMAVITFLSQVLVTGQILTIGGLIPSLALLPAGLFAGCVGMLIWPGLSSATIARVTDGALRSSVNQSGMEVLYLPLPASVRARVKSFLDVVVQRLGDGVAGLIVLFYALFVMKSDPAVLIYFSLALILIWAMFIFMLRSGYLAALRTGLETRTISWNGYEVDYADKRTVETVLQTLQQQDEQTVLFGLELADKLDPERVIPRLPSNLLEHPSPLVRNSSLRIFAKNATPEQMKQIVPLLQDESRYVQAEAISVVCAVRKEDAIPLMRPYLESGDPKVQRSAIACLLHHGDAEIRDLAMSAFHEMIASSGSDGVESRIESARLIGELDDPEFTADLRKLIEEDPSVRVVREALLAAGKRKEPTVLKEVIAKLRSAQTKNCARDALIEYGDQAVEALGSALLDGDLPHAIRLSIPETLSRIGSQSALTALLGGLNQKDGSVRYRVIVALEEIARRLPNLIVDRRVIETALFAEATHYYRRFLVLFTLFGDGNDLSMNGRSLLHQALLENMEREKERVLRLLSLLFPDEDMHSAAAALRSGSRAAQARAIEFLDNLLTGEIKRHVFPLFDDARGLDQFEKFLALLGGRRFDAETALRELLQQDDVWLKAATLWEIGLRGLQSFRESVAHFLNSKNPVIKETAELVMSRI